MRVLICGGGVIGAAIAYFSSLKQAEVVVIERTGVACAASGKSGGFLALDWCDGSPLAPLARRSFELHAELASAFDGRWGYRRLETLSVVASARRPLSAASRLAPPEWLARDAIVHQRLGTTATTAQVHPAQFTRGMLDAAIERGARLRAGCVTGLARSADGSRVSGVFVDGELIEGDAVVIAMGPWSALASRVAAPADGVRAQGPQRDPAQPDADLAARPVRRVRGNGRLGRHARGVPAARRHGLRVRPLERRAAAAGSRRDHLRCRRRKRSSKAMIRTFAPALADAAVVAAQACYRPVTQGRSAVDGPGAGSGGRVCGYRPQRLGNVERAGDRRGDGRAHRRGCREDGRHHPVRPRAPRAPDVSGARRTSL